MCRTERVSQNSNSWADVVVMSLRKPRAQVEVRGGGGGRGDDGNQVLILRNQLSMIQRKEDGDITVKKRRKVEV